MICVYDTPVFYTPTKADKTAVIVYEYYDQPMRSWTYSMDPDLNFTSNNGRAFSVYPNKGNECRLAYVPTLPVHRKRRCAALKDSVHRCEGFFSLTPQSHATCDEYDHSQSKNASAQITALAVSSSKAVAAQAQYNPVCKLHSPCADWGADLQTSASKAALPFPLPNSRIKTLRACGGVLVPFQDPGAIVCKIPDSGGGGEIDLRSVSALGSDYTSSIRGQQAAIKCGPQWLLQVQFHLCPKSI
jgi:hypothetical protein